MGKAVAFVYKGQEIKVCDKSEKADFDKDPGQILEKTGRRRSQIKKVNRDACESRFQTT